MRQFISIRFWMTLLALAGLFAGLWYVLVRDDTSAIRAVVTPTTEEHNIDLVALVYAVQADDGFTMKNGETTGELRLIIDGTRVMVIKPGTPGDISCVELAELARCVVAADLLGDGVIWFSLVPGAPKSTVTLPAVVTVRGDNVVLLANGWVVRRASVVKVVCDTDDVSTLGEFVRRFGARASSTYTFEKQQVTSVVCPGASEPPPTDPIATTTTVPISLPGTAAP